jgi:hypothetical protein
METSSPSLLQPPSSLPPITPSPLSRTASFVDILKKQQFLSSLASFKRTPSSLAICNRNKDAELNTNEKIFSESKPIGLRTMTYRSRIPKKKKKQKRKIIRSRFVDDGTLSNLLTEEQVIKLHSDYGIEEYKN